MAVGCVYAFACILGTQLMKYPDMTVTLNNPPCYCMCPYDSLLQDAVFHLNFLAHLPRAGEVQIVTCQEVIHS